jgi:aryl-alcohol dehydrogenase-like predicted oxidoreductase
MIGMIRINNTDLDVFPLALGGNVFGWTSDEDQSFAVLDAYARAGGNFIDTADGYSAWVPGNSGGESETIIGRWMATRGNRDQIVVATKVSTHPEAKGLSRATVRRAIDASLRRLQTDHVDLYYAHFDDPNTPLEETVSAFGELVRAGKVRYIAVSNYTAQRVEEWLKITEAEGLPRIVAQQPHYNLVERDKFEGGLRDLALREGLSIVPYYALASGFLTGKYRDGAAAGDSPRAGGAAAYLDDRGRRVLAALDEVAAAHSTAVATVALAWLAAQPTVVAPLASARTVDQLPDLLAVADLRLTDDEIQRLTQASE